MGHYPFTLFNGITLLVLVLALLVGWRYWRGSLQSTWPLVCYVFIVAYSLSFSGSLNYWWVAAGVVCAAAIRVGVCPRAARIVELAPLAYIVWRCVGLILMW